MLAPVVRGVIDEWTTCLASVRAAAGHDLEEARDLAELCICAVEGAITLARIEGTSQPLRLVAQRLSPLL